MKWLNINTVASILLFIAMIRVSVSLYGYVVEASYDSIAGEVAYLLIAAPLLIANVWVAVKRIRNK
jgi:uncharacterized membrane-anchored protein